MLRRVLLDAASALLVAEGPGALTMRRVAGAVGCSTTVLYTMFGGKEGLADALAEPAYYGVVFQQAIPRFRPSAASLAAAGVSLAVSAVTLGVSLL